MKGFKKDGKFRPTEKRRKSALTKSDIRKKETVLPPRDEKKFKKMMARIEKENYEHQQLEFPILRDNNDGKIGVMWNKTGHKPPYETIPILDIPKNELNEDNIQFLAEFDDVRDAFEFQDYASTSYYGCSFDEQCEKWLEEMEQKYGDINFKH